MEVGMLVTRCRMMHPGRAVGSTLRKAASDEYLERLMRSGRTKMPVTERAFVGTPPSKRTILLEQWEIAFPVRKETTMDRWLIKGAAGPNLPG